MEMQNKVLLFGLILLVLTSCRVAKHESRKSQLELDEQVQAVRIATKQVDRLILRLDSSSLTIAQFDTLGRITSLTTAKQGTRTETKEQINEADSIQAKGEKQLFGISEQLVESKTDSSFKPPSALWWVLGAVLLLMIVGLLVKLSRK